MTDVLALAERMWNGDEDYHPFRGAGSRCEVARRRGVRRTAFANVTAFATADGLVLVDTGSVFLADVCTTRSARGRRRPLHTAVYTHGHIDHVFGVERYEAENAAAGDPRRGSSPTRRSRALRPLP